MIAPPENLALSKLTVPPENLAPVKLPPSKTISVPINAAN
jgi:hypothetical protein